MVKRIGYLNGIDPMVLSVLAANGIGTIPISNGWDDHGKYIAHITEADGLSAVIAPFHKVIAAPGDPVGPHDVLSPAIDNGIPVLLVIPKKVMKKARNILPRPEPILITPDTLLAKLFGILEIKF